MSEYKKFIAVAVAAIETINETKINKKIDNPKKSVIT
jgi:hypothetical protein